VIKIITGWSNQGGSTIAHINLCNLFNDNGLECILYGPHDWHLDKCRAALINKFIVDKNDVIIVHFFPIEVKLNCKKMIYSCHETHIKPINSFNYKIYDTLHFVSNSQYQWHKLHDNVNYRIIPNVVIPLNKSPLNTSTAGVIGSVDRFKQTHISIKRALDSGYNKVLIYGNITDIEYYNQYIHPYIHNGNVVYMGHNNDRQEMYNSIDEVFHSSIRETFNFIKAECYYTKVKYNGLESSKTDAELWSNTDILNAWKGIILDGTTN
jgi:hypothetical protein